MAGIFTKYRVVLEGTIVPEANREDVLQSLARIFSSNPMKMESLLQGQPVSLKKEYLEDDANLICRKIRKAGAECRIEEIPEVELDILSEDTLLPVENRDFPPGFGGAVVRDGSEARESKLGKDVMFRLMMTYVNRNVDFYSRKFKKFGNPRNPTFKLTWNWPALFFFFPWALYRKMWVYAAIYVVGGMVLALYTPSILITLGWMFLWPCIANYLYFKQAAGAAQAAIAKPGSDKTLAKSGGVSRLAVVLGIVFTMVVSSMTSNSPAGRTSLTMSYLASSLKLLLVADENNKNQQAINDFVATLENGEIKDGWGNSIQIETEPSEYLLRSAGPDGNFRTGDDLVQSVSRE